MLQELMGDDSFVKGIKMTNKPFAEALDEAAQILNEYREPNSLIDNGNLFYAATTYQQALRATLDEVKGLVKFCKQFKAYLESPTASVQDVVLHGQVCDALTAYQKAQGEK